VSKEAYHSALVKPWDGAPASRFEIGGSVALTHNIWHGLPKELSSCDVVYSEPPWKAGYEVFNSRCGSVGYPAFSEFAANLDRLARSLTVPVFLMAGRTDSKLYRPDAVRAMELNDDNREAVVMLYRAELPAGLTKAGDMLEYLAGRFSRVGDFACGYGRAGRVFARSGKSFVLSDFDPKCIGHIAAHAAAWFPQASAHV
jgi:hypothetical protein